MSLSTRPVDLEKFLDVAAADPTAIVWVEKKPKKNKTWNPNVGYLDVSYCMNVEDKPVQMCFYVRDAYIAGNLMDPDTSLYSKNPDGTFKDKVSVQLSLNNSGRIGEFVKLLNTSRDEFIKKSEASKEMSGWSSKGLKPLIRTTYSEDVASDEFKGKPLQDPVDNTKDDSRCYLKFDFSKYPTYDSIPESKRGKQVTVIKDFSTGKLVDGKIEYEDAMVDGEPVTNMNFHKILTRGSKIVELYFAHGTTSKSSYGINTDIVVAKAVIEFAPNMSQTLQEVDNSDLIARLAAHSIKAKETAAQEETKPAATKVEGVLSTKVEEEETEPAATKVAEPIADASAAAAAAIDML